METYKLRAITAQLTDFDYLAKEHDFIEVSEWRNGEGCIIMINDKMISLTYGELKAINTLVGLLELNKPTIKNND